MDWTNAVPPYESQYSATTHTDAENCISESFCHIIYMLTRRRYSPRALALMSGTTPQGNSVNNVLLAANTQGLIPYELWPTPDSFTWDEYYAPIPPEVLVKGEKLAVTILTGGSILNSPLWTQLIFPTTQHAVAQINRTQYFDSEQGNPVKTITTPVGFQYALRINKPPMNNFVTTMNYNGTIGGFIALSDPNQVQFFNNVFNTNIVIQPDGTIPTQVSVVDAPKVV